MMSSEEKIKIIPLDRPFLRDLAQYFFDRHKESSPDFSRFLIVFPTQRNKLYFRRYLLDASKSSGILPPVMKSMDELIDIFYESSGGEKGMMLDGAERNFILKSVVRGLKIEYWHDMPFLKFIAIGKRLLYFFDELAKEEIGFDQVDELVRLGHYPEKFVKHELSLIRAIYDDFRRAVRDAGYYDTIDKCRAVFDKADTSFLDKYYHIYIAGLVATTRLDNIIIDKILTEQKAELILHSSIDSPEPDAATATPVYLHQKILKSIRHKAIGKIKTPVSSDVGPPVIHITGTKSMFHQTLHIKEAIRAVKDRYEPHRIAVVLTDEKCLYPIVNILKSSGLNFNLSAGLPMMQAPLYTFLEQLVDAVKSGFHYTEFFVFLKHPLNKNAVIKDRSMRPLIYELLQTMIRARNNYFRPDEFKSDNMKPLISLLEKYHDAVVLQEPLRDYILNLIRTLNDIIFYNKDFLKTSNDSTGDLLDRIDKISKLRIGLDSAGSGIENLQFIVDILRDDNFKTTGDPMKGIQVIGILEARNLDFDCIILPSMNEGIFPKRSEKDLFVNQQVRREIGLPYDKERESLFHYYYSEMVSGKKEVFLSYIKGEQTDIRSRFIDFQIAKGAGFKEDDIKLSSSMKKMKERSVKKNSDLLRKLIHKLTARGLSPINLKNYRECPYRFYLRYLLGMKKPEAVVEEAEHMEWGRIIHRALYNFYKYDLDQGIINRPLKVLKPLLYKRLDRALENELAARPKMINILDLEVYKMRLDRFLDNEEERSKAGYVVMTDMIEQQISCTLSVNNINVKLYGYPDRIEREGGKYNILDYKNTIPLKKRYEIGEAFVEFQLPLYGMILSQDDFSLIRSLAYYRISRDVRISNICDEHDIPGYLVDFKEKILLPTIEEILSPDKPFCQTRTKTACKYCDFVALCGVANA